MSTHLIRDDQGRVTTILTLADIYHYKGFTFEFHRYLGPTKLKKDGEIAARTGRKFWKAFGEWFELTDEEKDDTRISG